MPFAISRLLSSRETDIGQGMITVLIWKRACINLFITYFNIELKKKITSHTDTKLMNMSDRYRLRILLPKHQQIFPRWTSTFSKRQLTVTSWGSREAWYRVIRVLPRWQISLWHFWCLCMGKIDVITYKYVIKCNKVLNVSDFQGVVPILNLLFIT